MRKRIEWRTEEERTGAREGSEHTTSRMTSITEDRADWRLWLFTGRCFKHLYSEMKGQINSSRLGSGCLCQMCGNVGRNVTVFPQQTLCLHIQLKEREGGDAGRREEGCLRSQRYEENASLWTALFCVGKVRGEISRAAMPWWRRTTKTHSSWAEALSVRASTSLHINSICTLFDIKHSFIDCCMNAAVWSVTCSLREQFIRDVLTSSQQWSLLVIYPRWAINQ